MRDLFDSFGELRQDFGDIMQDLGNSRRDEQVCGTYEQIGQFTSGLKNLPEEFTTKFAEGAQACKAGDQETAAQILGDLEQFRPQIERLAKSSGISKDQLGDLQGLSKDELVAKLLDDPEVQAKFMSRFADKISEQVALMVNEKTKALVEQVSQLESKLAVALVDKQAKVLDVISVMDQKKQEAVAEGKTAVVEAVKDIDTKVSNLNLPQNVQNQYKDMLDIATARIVTPETADKMSKEFNALLASVETAGSKDEQLAILKDEIPKVDATIQNLYKADAPNLVKQGFVPSKDMVGKETEWYGKDVFAASGKGFVKGDANGNINPDQPTNFAEGITILARAKAGGDTAVNATPENINLPGVRAFPEWARPAATYAAEHGVDLQGVLEGKSAAAPMPRVDMMEAGAQIFGLKPQNQSGTLGKFGDAKGLTPAEQAGAAALVEEGIVGGQGGTGNLDPNGALNRASFMKIVNQLDEKVGK